MEVNFKSMQIEQIPINKIKVDKHQPRQTIDQDRVKDMAQSVLTEGIINPIEVDRNFVIITGEMRYRAAKEAGMRVVPCKVLDIDPKERFRRQVIENIHHNTMTDWDTAKALQKMLQVALDTLGKSVHGGHEDQGISKVAKMIGKSKRYVIDHLSILGMSEPLQKAIKDQKIPYTFIRPIVRLNPEYREKMEQKILAGHFKTRDEALEMTEALRRNPEKAEEILKTKTPAELFKISPPPHLIVKERLKPTSEFLHLQKALLAWLKKYQPDDIVHKDRFLLVLGMSTIVDNLNAWGKVANKLELTKGK